MVKFQMIFRELKAERSSVYGGNSVQIIHRVPPRTFRMFPLVRATEAREAREQKTRLKGRGRSEVRSEAEEEARRSCPSSKELGHKCHKFRIVDTARRRGVSGAMFQLHQPSKGEPELSSMLWGTIDFAIDQWGDATCRSVRQRRNSSAEFNIENSERKDDIGNTTSDQSFFPFVSRYIVRMYRLERKVSE